MENPEPVLSTRGSPVGVPCDGQVQFIEKNERTPLLTNGNARKVGLSEGIPIPRRGRVIISGSAPASVVSFLSPR